MYISSYSFTEHCHLDLLDFAMWVMSTIEQLTFGIAFPSSTLFSASINAASQKAIVYKIQVVS